MTAGWDNALRVWPWRRLLQEADESAAPSKKARTSGGPRGAADVAVAHECSAVLTGHSQAVSGVAWAGDGAVVSSSWDHSLKKWDIFRGQMVDTMATGKALLCVASSGAPGGAVAAGGADGTLRIWDARSAKGDALVRPD